MAAILAAARELLALVTAGLSFTSVRTEGSHWLADAIQPFGIYKTYLQRPAALRLFNRHAADRGSAGHQQTVGHQRLALALSVPSGDCPGISVQRCSVGVVYVEIL